VDVNSFSHEKEFTEKLARETAKNGSLFSNFLIRKSSKESLESLN
jgi:hypothetical protein